MHSQFAKAFGDALICYNVLRSQAVSSSFIKVRKRSHMNKQ